MSRDPNKLRVFHDAHELTLAIYRETRDFPRDEWFGIRAQMRRAAVSVPSNLVEGSARSGDRDYLKFLHVALGSACEVRYLTTLTRELGYATAPSWTEIESRSGAVVRQLQRLVQGVEKFALTTTARVRQRERTRTRN